MSDNLQNGQGQGYLQHQLVHPIYNDPVLTDDLNSFEAQVWEKLIGDSPIILSDYSGLTLEENLLPPNDNDVPMYVNLLPKANADFEKPEVGNPIGNGSGESPLNVLPGPVPVPANVPGSLPIVSYAVYKEPDPLADWIAKAIAELEKPEGENLVGIGSAELLSNILPGSVPVGANVPESFPNSTIVVDGWNPVLPVGTTASSSGGLILASSSQGAPENTLIEASSSLTKVRKGRSRVTGSQVRAPVVQGEVKRRSKKPPTEQQLKREKDRSKRNREKSKKTSKEKDDLIILLRQEVLKMKIELEEKNRIILDLQKPKKGARQPRSI